MAYWTVSTVEKKSCEEHEFWVKDSETIVRISGFRWGTFRVETSDDNPPEGIDAENPDGIDMYSHSGDNIVDIELVSMDDGWFVDVEYPDNMSDEERSRMDELWEEDYYDGWEGDGWTQDETEAWLFGPLEIVRD